MIVRSFVVVALLGLNLGAFADYGYPAPPKLIIKEAGPSKSYPWIGYTHHYPRTIPRPLLLYKWNPYRDPTYTAFWVSPKHGVHGGAGVGGGGGGGGGVGIGGGGGYTEGKIPHGFGHPKGSTLVIGGGDISGIVHGGGDIQTYPHDDGAIPPLVHGGGHSDEVIHPAQLVHTEHSVHDHAAPLVVDSQPVVSFQDEVVPLVKPPHSDPLPLENEGHFQENSVVASEFDPHTNIH